jgi:hypothetical protein
MKPGQSKNKKGEKKMIYVMHIREIVPDKMNEYNEFQVKEFQPLLKKVGQKVVAYWTTMIGNAAESVAIFAFDDLANMQRFNEEATKNPDYVKAVSKLMSMTVSSNSRLLRPCAWSPLK